MSAAKLFARSSSVVTPGLSICRNSARSAPSRSKAVDSAAAHSFQTGCCDVRVFPVSDKPDRFYCYENVCPILPERKKDRLPAVMGLFFVLSCYDMTFRTGLTRRKCIAISGVVSGQSSSYVMGIFLAFSNSASSASLNCRLTTLI